MEPMIEVIRRWAAANTHWTLRELPGIPGEQAKVKLMMGGVTLESEAPTVEEAGDRLYQALELMGDPEVGGLCS